MKLNEDNKSIDQLISAINKRVVELRTSDKLKNEPILTADLKTIYDKYINKFYEDYALLDTEIPLDAENELINILLETYELLKQL